MGIAQILKIIGPVKLILLALFVILPCVELVDGKFGHEDIFSLVVLFLLVNDLVHDIKRVLTPKINLNVENTSSDFWDDIKNATYLRVGPASDFFYVSKSGPCIREMLNQNEKSLNQLSFAQQSRPQIHSMAIKRDRSLKQKMNVIFMVLCCLPWVIDWFYLGQDVQNKVFLMCMMAWSMAILAVSLREYRLKKLKLVYYNLAFWTFIISALSWPW